MLKIGITGGIGTGKSTVCRIFNVLGMPTYDADQEAKELYNSNPALKAWVKSRFGEALYEKDVFQKSKLAEIVFNNAQALKELNKKVHPIIIAAGNNWFAEQQKDYAIKEAALLIESGGYKELDKLILVKTPLVERIKRIKKRDNSTEDQITNRINKQMPEDEKEAFADFVINNDSNDLLIDQVLVIHEKIKALCD